MVGCQTMQFLEVSKFENENRAPLQKLTMCDAISHLRHRCTIVLKHFN